jgi:hypothetical protein
MLTLNPRRNSRDTSDSSKKPTLEEILQTWQVASPSLFDRSLSQVWMLLVFYSPFMSSLDERVRYYSIFLSQTPHRIIKHYIHTYIHTYHSRLIPEGVAAVSQIFLRNTHVLPKLISYERLIIFKSPFTTFVIYRSICHILFRRSKQQPRCL